MPKSIAVTCQVCLSVNDPADVLAVKVEHATIPQPDPIRLCRLCTLAIMKSAIASELIDPSEVFGAELPAASSNASASEAPGEGAAAATMTAAAASDAESSAAGELAQKHAANGAEAGPMPGGKCALDCGRPALADDIYCGECRATLRE